MKVNGIPMEFTIDDATGSPVTFSNEVGTITTNNSRGQQDTSGLDVDGTERLPLRFDGGFDFTGFWQPETVIPVFGDLTNARACTIVYPGATCTLTVNLTTFSVARNQDGSLGWTAAALQSDGNAAVWELAGS
jgi:hypothetical protein